MVSELANFSDKERNIYPLTEDILILCVHASIVQFSTTTADKHMTSPTYEVQRGLISLIGLEVEGLI